MDEAVPTPTPSPAPGPPHLADPRVAQILSTEHWSLLTSRSLAYNETFTRGGMFLTLLSASLVALGFVYQGGGGGTAFLGVVIAVLGLDLFVGLATLGRTVSASMEEFRALQAIARIRHAYLEMVPTLDPYISTPSHDDARSVLAAYGVGATRQSALMNVTHGLTTMPGLLIVLDSALVGGLVATVVIAFGGSDGAAVVVGLLSGGVALALLSAYSVRTFGDLTRFLAVRFPPPEPGSPPGR